MKNIQQQARNAHDEAVFYEESLEGKKKLLALLQSSCSDEDSNQWVTHCLTENIRAQTVTCNAKNSQLESLENANVLI